MDGTADSRMDSARVKARGEAKVLLPWWVNPQSAGNMSGDNEDVIDALDDLAECCKDGDYGFRACAEQAKARRAQVGLPATCRRLSRRSRGTL